MSPADMTREGGIPLGLLAGRGMALALAMGIGRFAYTLILPAMEAAAHLDTNQAGILAAANYAGYLVGALAAAAITPGAARGRVLMAGTTSLVAWGNPPRRLRA